MQIAFFYIFTSSDESLLRLDVLLFVGTGSSNGLKISGANDGEPSGAYGSSGGETMPLVLPASEASSEKSPVSTSTSYFHSVSITSKSYENNFNFEITLYYEANTRTIID